MNQVLLEKFSWCVRHLNSGVFFILKKFQKTIDS